MNAAIPGFEESAAREMLFTFEDFERMDEAGVFGTPSARVELLEGKFYRMSPTSGGHGRSTAGLSFALLLALKNAGLDGPFEVVANGTLKIGDRSAPEPDLFVATPMKDPKYYTSAEAVLVVEIAYSTRDTDLNLKRSIYAKGGISECWVLEPERRRLQVFRSPQPDGLYASQVVVEGEGVVSPLFAPQIKLPLKDLL